MTTKATDCREIVLDILMEVLEKGNYSHLILNQALGKYQYLNKQDRAFITRVTEGTLEYLIQIDYVIGQYSTVKLAKMKPVIRTILRMSIYQIYYMDRVPDSAVCNEAVKLAVKRRFAGLKGFVNGILRTVVRGKEGVVFPNDSIRYSVPQWLLDMWSRSYDELTLHKILDSFLREGKLAVRCNLDRAGRAQILESLKRQNIGVTETEYSQAILYLEGYDYLEQVDAFRNGWIQVQDMSSGFVGLAAAPKPGDYVLDVCGAPGGKSLHIADLLQGTGYVDVRDLTESKVQLILENIARSGFQNIHASVVDAREFDENLAKKADIVIADLPCSGLGIIGKKPDIKYNMTPEKTEILVELQREILSMVSRYVKPGGTLVYSTCTINKRENEENADWFLSKFPFEAVNLEGRLGTQLTDASMKEGRIQLLPGIHPCDGFFIAVFRRKETE